MKDFRRPSRKNPSASDERANAKAGLKQDKPDSLNNEEVRFALIEGRNAVESAIKSEKTIDKVFIADGKVDKALRYIASLAREAGIPVVDCDRRRLDAMSETGAHQGVIAVAAAWNYSDVDDMLLLAKIRNEKPLLVICDGVTDPRNLGAIIRSAEVMGAHGVIIPKRRSAGLTAVVAKASAGAIERIPVARVPNVAALIDQLKKDGIWVYGAAADGKTSLYDAQLREACAFVVGSEGEGLGNLVARRCDGIVSIPMRGETGSLNVSAAATILLYEAVRQRFPGGSKS